jgi:hypothetical protein
MVTARRKEHLYHECHLLLGGVSITGNRLLYLPWGILHYLGAIFPGSQHSYSPGMTQNKCGMNILSVKSLLHTHSGWFMELNLLTKFIVDDFQTLRKRTGGISSNHPGINTGYGVILNLYYPVSGNCCSRVNAENNHS